MSCQDVSVICAACFEPAEHFTRHFLDDGSIWMYEAECDRHYTPDVNHLYYQGTEQITREEYLLCLIKQKL